MGGAVFHGTPKVSRPCGKPSKEEMENGENKWPLLLSFCLWLIWDE